MRVANRKTGLRLRVVLEPGVAFGPGKADLLDGIAGTGSIAAAGRALGMSYKRAWGLVEDMNKDFRQPLVATSKGGKSFGGAELTETGTRVLKLFRAVEDKARAASLTELRALRRLMSE